MSSAVCVRVLYLSAGQVCHEAHELKQSYKHVQCGVLAVYLYRIDIAACVRAAEVEFRHKRVNRSEPPAAICSAAERSHACAAVQQLQLTPCSLLTHPVCTVLDCMRYQQLQWTQLTGATFHTQVNTRTDTLAVTQLYMRLPLCVMMLYNDRSVGHKYSLCPLMSTFFVFLN